MHRVVGQAPDGLWTLNLLGRSELRDPRGKLVRLATKKLLLLLAILSRNQGESIHRSSLAETVWPNCSSKAARDSLRNSLAALRKVLSPQSLAVDVEQVTLLEGLVWCDAFSDCGYESYAGDFMPGFENDWVIDQRLRLRESAVQAALLHARSKWEFGDQAGALQIADRACQIDPLSQDAVSAKVRLLEETGKVSQAVSISDAYRAKAMRDLGVVSEVRPNLQASGETAHPLVIAAEWLLGEDPDQAIGLLASTHSQWMTMNVEPALSLHERTLQSSVVDNTARRLVEAQYLNLLWMAGRLGSHMDRAHRAFEWAVEAGENLTATRLAGALSYGWLSRGEFRQALSYAERAFAIASKSCDRLIQNEYEMHRGIIQGQLGMLGARQATITNYHRRVEEHPTPQEIASIGLQTFELRLAEGRPDLAASGLETSRRIFSSVAGSRMIAWVLQAEAVLHQSVGDLERARNSLEQIKAIGPEMAGHSVTAMCDDELACVDCRLGEYDSAAEALARASVYRKRMGTVQSVYERSRVRPARRVLQERLDSRDFRAAFSRAAASARPAAGR